MTTLIYPKVLKAYRKKKHWTQEQLAEGTKGRDRISLPTIKRIESTKEDSYSANDRVAKALSKALGVTIEQLSQPSSKDKNFEASLLDIGYQPLRTMVDPETSLAFDMVSDIYGVSKRSQIEMAPLFMALLAEASLAWRRERVDEIEEAANRLWDLGGGHFSFANAAYSAVDGAHAERKSIAKRDMFGEDVGNEAFDFGFDPSENNPFADFLEHLAKKIEAKTISFDKTLGWKTSEGLPNYRIGADIISQLTGDDYDAEYALLRRHVRLEEVPDDLLDEEKKAERVAWMIARIPEKEISKIRADRQKLSGLFEILDLTGSKQTPDQAKGGEHG
jgi:transcriptional regulator with XRE-family HTH domain